MSAVLSILDDLAQLGVIATANGDKLHLNAPRGALTPDLLDRLRVHKQDLLALLRAGDAEAGPLPSGGRTILRGQVAKLIRRARRIDAGQAVAFRDSWRERLFICTLDGGVTIEVAEQIAMAELEARTLL